MIDERSQEIDSIWTDKNKALKRKKEIEKYLTDNLLESDRMTNPYMGEIELDQVINFDLDIQLYRDAKGRPITKEVKI